MRVAGASEAEFQAWVAAGDARRAAEWLVHRYADEVMGLCVAMVRDRSLAEDLTQDVFGRAFTGLAGFRGEASSRTWLLRIAKNRCIDYLRAERRDLDAGDTDEDIDAQPDAAPLPGDLLSRREDVEAALAALTEIERALIVLRFRNGLEYGELAVAFGLREGAVRMRVSRALTKMRHALEAREEGLLEVAADAMPASFDLEPPAARGAPPAAAPASAPRAAPPRPAAPERSGALAGRLRGVFRRDVPAPAAPSPPVEHPLTAYFAVTRRALTPGLRDALVARARRI